MTIHQIDLKNQIKMLCDYIPGSHIISIKIIFKVGSQDELLFPQGISHCLEHMNFKGTKTITTSELAKEFDEMGGYFGASTSRTYTIYSAKVVKENAERAISILSDMIINSIYPEEELAREKNVIIQEIIECNDDPQNIIYDLLYKQAYLNQQFGNEIAGNITTVQNITKDDLINYSNEYYTGSNLIIGITGSIHPNDAEQIVKKYFNILPTGKEKSKQEIQYVGGVIKKTKYIEQIHLIIALNARVASDPRYIVQELCASILGGGMSSRFFQEIREKQGLAYNISACMLGNDATGMLLIETTSSPENLNRLLDSILDQLKIMHDTVTDIELQKAKIQAKTSIIFSQETISSRNSRMLSDLAIFGRVIPLHEKFEQIEQVQITDIKDEIIALISNTKIYPPTICAVGKKSREMELLDIISNNLMQI